MFFSICKKHLFLFMPALKAQLLKEVVAAVGRVARRLKKAQLLLRLKKFHLLRVEKEVSLTHRKQF